MEKILKKYYLENIDKTEIITKTFTKGKSITTEGNIFDYVYLLTSGKAKVCRYGENGRDIILAYYIEEGILGDIELALNSTTLETTSIALSDCHCLILPKEIVLKQLTTNINFSLTLNKILAKKLVNAANGFSNSAIKDATSRLCDYILTHSENDTFQHKLNDTASSIGISYRHLNRLLKKLCDSNIIKKQKNGYKIINKIKLSEISA